MWTGRILHRIGSCGRPLWTRKWISGFHKRR